MRSSFRYLILTVLAAFVMAFSSISTDAIADDGKAALKVAPKETTGVVAINIERIKTSPAYKTVMAALSADADFQKALKEAKEKIGLDLEKDINSIVILLPANVAEGQMLVVASGNFDQAKIMAAAKAEGGVEETVGGQVIVKDADGKGAVAFAGGLVLFGTEPMVKSALSSGGAIASGGVSKLMSAVDTSKDLWVAMEVPASLKGLDPTLKDINSVTASLDLSAGLGLKLTVDTTSADQAKKLAEMANAGLAQAGKDPTLASMGLAAAVGRTKIAAAGSAINVDVSVTGAELEAIQKTISAMMGGAP